MINPLLTEALKLIIEAEGGSKLSLDSRDPGNYRNGKLVGTKFGIAAASHPNVNIRELTESEAIQIYEEEYANPIEFDKLTRGIGYCVLDAAVQNGPHEAKRWYTECATRSITDDHFIVRFCATRMAMEKNLHIWEKEHAGLERRIDNTEKTALAMLKSKISDPAQMSFLGKLYNAIQNIS